MLARTSCRILSIALFACAVGCNIVFFGRPIPEFSPTEWPKEVRDRYVALQTGAGFDWQERKRIEPQRSTEGSQMMIASTNEPLAVRIGFEVLKQGGTAADAVVATAMAQVALTAGAAISYAGMTTAIYYDAGSGKVAAMNASFNTVQGETEPLTIPKEGQHSGRSALVPGFLAGMHSLHQRFGKLPWSALIEPATWIADTGVPLSPIVHSWISTQNTVLSRLPATRRVFTKSDGDFYQSGDLFRQPELASTLKRIASTGSAYMYTGQWARHFVEAVQAEGGKMTLSDLAAYRPLWTEPARTSYRGYEVVTPGPPNRAASVLLALKLAERGDIAKYGHYAQSAEALYYLIQASRISSLYFLQKPALLEQLLPDVDPSPAARLSATTVDRLWTHIQQPAWHATMAKLIPDGRIPGHSAAIIAVDQRGNVVSLLHSINTVMWGSTGLFVDGVSIPDPAAFQQEGIARVGPGVRLPEPTNPLLVLKEGRPFVASAAVGSALQEATLQNLINVLDFDMDPKTALQQPTTQGPYLGFNLNKPLEPEYEKEAVGTGTFPKAVLDGVVARGQAIKPVSGYGQAGFWVGVRIDPGTRRLRGASSPMVPSSIEAQ